ncbi:Uncharacterized protein DBV15_11019 [Temnothorax longispinosus]|uniref:Uncharacterized protein n=1 Tax=Temnothorax longispinosus TaxID=300112 RepID=A0A4S2KMJ1_9HYME|nr:Uncharacterized protein DBV15_11019 [Temnothorax longispinosus]
MARIRIIKKKEIQKCCKSGILPPCGEVLFDPVKPSRMDLAVVQFPPPSEPIIGEARYRSRGICAQVKQASESGVPTSEQLINEANCSYVDRAVDSYSSSLACALVCMHCTAPYEDTHASASIWSIIEYLAARAEDSADWSVVAGWLTRLVAFGSPSSSRLAQSYSNRASDRVVCYPSLAISRLRCVRVRIRQLAMRDVPRCTSPRAVVPRTRVDRYEA